MLPLKWKIFKVLNYLQLFSSICIAGLIVYTSFLRGGDPDISIFPFIFLFCFCILTASAILNIYVLDRNLPDKPLTGFTNSLHYIFLISALIINLGLLTIMIAGIIDMADSRFNNTGTWVGLGIFFFVWLINLLILITQFQLKPYIRKNYQKNFTRLIDSIGKD